MLGSSSTTPAIPRGAQDYHGCKLTTQLKKTFRVFKSYSRKSMSVVQGV